MNKDELYDIIDRLTDKLMFQGLSGDERRELTKSQKILAEIEKYEQVALVEDKKSKSREMKRRRGRGRYGEQRLAKKVGGIVCGRSKAVKLPSGKYIQINCQRPPDVVTEMFSFESKWLKNPPKIIDKIMTQAITNAPQDLIPVGVVGDREQRTVFYIMSEKDWLDLHG